jgi:hypothetical protein
MSPCPEDFTVFIENDDVVAGVIGGHVDLAGVINDHFVAIFDGKLLGVTAAPVGIDAIPEVAVADDGVAG